jgi:hypothetical protein
MQAHEVRSTNRTIEFEEFLHRICLHLPARENKASCCLWKSMQDRIKKHRNHNGFGIHEGGIATDPQYVHGAADGRFATRVGAARSSGAGALKSEGSWLASQPDPSMLCPILFFNAATSVFIAYECTESS